MGKKILIFLLAYSLVFNLFAISYVKAQTRPVRLMYERIMNVDEPAYINESTISIKTRIKITDASGFLGIGNVTLISVNVSLNLVKESTRTDAYDNIIEKWKINEIIFSELEPYGTQRPLKSRIIHNGRGLEIITPTEERLKTIDYRNIGQGTDSVNRRANPEFTVIKSGGRGTGMISSRGDESSPVSVIASSLIPAKVVHGSVEERNLDEWSINIQCLDNAGAFNNVKIINKGSLPPKINIPSNDRCNTSEISFVLANVIISKEGNPSLLGNLHPALNVFTPIDFIQHQERDVANNVFFAFVNQQDIPVSIMVDLDGDLLVLVLGPDGKTVTREGELGGLFFDNTANKESLNNYIISRVFVSPDCQDHTKNPLPYNKKTDAYKNQRPDNQCLYTEDNGWLNKWGVGITIQTGGGGCQLSTLFRGGFTGIISQMIDCLLHEFVRPILDWAAGLVSESAGLSYINCHDNKRRLSWLE